MKVRLLKDWMGFVTGQEFEDTDGVFEFSSIEENHSEYSSSTTTYNGTFSKEVIKELEDIFEIVEDQEVAEERAEIEQGIQNEIHAEAKSYISHSEPSLTKVDLKSEEEVKERLSNIYKDIKVLKQFDTELESINSVIHVLENMAYSLEWVLGNINE